MRTIQYLWPLRAVIIGLRRWVYVHVWGMDLHPTCRLARTVRLDLTYPAGIHIGAYTYLAFEAAVLTHDTARGLYQHTRIGINCFIGARAIILPGVTIGDGCIIGAGSVVTRDIPPHSIAVGNPARVIRTDIRVGPYGRLKSADVTEAKCRKNLHLIPKVVARHAT